MDEFPVLNTTDLDPAQKDLWDELTIGPRGFYVGGPDARRLPDLYNAWLQFPEFGTTMLRLGDHVRACRELNGRLREIVVLTTSARLGAMVEFDFHVPFARNEGLEDEVIAAIREGAAPPFSERSDAVVHDANIQLLERATLAPELREEMLGLLGFRGLMQLVAVVTLYQATAYTTNLARVRLADDFSADERQLRDFFAGRRG